MTTEKLQKVLARAGMGSRRAMEAVIESGRVEVDGKPAKLGDRVGPSAKIRVDGRLMGARSLAEPERRVIAYHKPTGEVVSRSDPEGRRTAFDRLPRLETGRWVAVGRLDINTSGLLLLTTDGELANRLMHPSHQLARDYAVRIYGRVEPEMLKRLLAGVTLEDGDAAFESIEPIDTQRAANEWYRVRLREGRNRLVRRLWESQGVQVSRLMRVRYGPVELPPGLREGQVQALSAGEVRHLAELVGLPAPRVQKPRPGATRRGSVERRRR